MKQSLVVAVVAALATAAHADVKIDLITELQAIAAKSPPLPDKPIAPATQGCTTPTKAERADAKKRVLAWIDAEHPDQRGETSSPPDDMGLVINVGCKEASGAFVLDVSQDRVPKKSQGTANGSRWNYLLRVSTSAIEKLTFSVTTHSQNWMEWAEEGRISLLAQVDVDGDGALDIVYSNHEHEGGSTNSYDGIRVLFANGKVGESGQVMNLSDVKVVGKQVVIAGQPREGGQIYVCLGRDLQLAPCAAAKSLQAAADRRAIIGQFSQIADGDLPDRELLAQQLATLGIPSKRRAMLVAAAAPTTADNRVQRQVTAFLVKAGLVEPAPMPAVIQQTHPEGRAYLDALATKLGDAGCTKTALTADDEARANAWVKKQDAKAQDIAIAPSACGPFLWLAWTPYNSGDSKRREVLLGRDGTTRVLGFTYELQMPGGLGQDHFESWFTHDGITVGIAIGAQNLWVIANGKIVAQTKGDTLAMYRFDDRWSETSRSIFLDGGTLWHATPTGRERLDRALVQDHEAKRAAIALLSQSPASKDAKYIAALQLLGADKALIAAAKKLP